MINRAGRIARLALSMLMACAADEEPDPLVHRFAHRPVALIASSELPEECIASLEMSVLWFRSQGATLTLDVMPPDTRVLLGVPVGGQVGVVPARFSPNVLEETVRSYTVGGDIFGAEIDLQECDALVVAHGVGHALGLEHAQLGTLMYYTIEGCDWSLTPEQISWVAD